MRIINYKALSKTKKSELLKRPSIDMLETYQIVRPILDEIKHIGHKSIIKYARIYDGFSGKQLRVNQRELEKSEKLVTLNYKKAVKSAIGNIKKFHKLQKPQNYSVETLDGIKCSRKFKPIDNVGLYIPGGTAILPSTLLMLAIPAIIAGCRRIVVCTPSSKYVNPEVLFAAKILGINEIYKVGGAQAIGLMAYGTDRIPKVNKIFGPGNQFVTAAKALVSIDPNGSAIDMNAGPSELLIIGDESARPDFIASDLLAQAEHGIDSQVILCTTNVEIALKVKEEINVQIDKLNRKDIVEKSLKNSFILLFDNISEAVDFCNAYAPEHLMLSLKNNKSHLRRINNAGSVFIGNYSPESAGDYASGTNHSLPTYGYAKSMGGIGVEQFMKGISYQELSKKGLENISSTVIEIAETEKLQAHANSVKIRLAK